MKGAFLLAFVALVATCHGWDYKSSGSNWGGTCSGVFQSPIDIKFPEHTGGADSHELEVVYPVVNAWESALRVEHTGSALRIPAQGHDLGHVFYAGNKYWVREVVFHSPGEHTIRGVKYAMEVQIVHQQEGAVGNEHVVIISALFQIAARPNGKASTFLEKSLFWDKLPTGLGKETLLHGPFTLCGFLDGLMNGYWTYRGSMTQPPCSTGVVWNVLETIQEMTPAQALRINQLFKGNFSFAKGKGNNRAIQSLGGRQIALHNHKPHADGDGKPVPTLKPPPENVHKPHDLLKTAPEDVPVKKHWKPLPNRPVTLPKLYQHHGKDWTGLCSTGRSQSPIDIKPAFGNPHGDYEFTHNYKPIASKVYNDGKTLRLKGKFGTLKVESDTDPTPFTAKEIRFHSPAEHTVDGRRAPLEMQIIHDKGTLAAQRYAVVSILFYESLQGPSDFLDSLSWKRLPPRKGSYVSLPVKVNLNLLKGLNKGYYSYAGSLTQPPCTEGVMHFVMRTYNPVSRFQLKQFQALFNGNYREIQTSRGRGVAVQGVSPGQCILPRYRNQGTALVP